MKTSQLFDDNAFFRSESEIKKCIRSSKNYENEDTSSAKSFLFFSTSKQRTYLVATMERLYCILDDSRKDKPHINWSLPREKVADANGLVFSITSRVKSDKTGLVDIGPQHKNWLFSKKLFQSSSIESSMKEVIESSMYKPHNNRLHSDKMK